MIIRIFDTAIEADDVERAKELFREQVRPAFETWEGCAGIDMHLSVDEHSGDLVEVAAISRWESRAAIERAVAADAYDDAMRALKALFRQTPIVRHFEAVD
jgi:quinol monooxygenase YgiN